jgi:predicted molibdopterin-dependent oxidoreductase YjgC
MKATISDRVAEGVVLVPHGWPGEANANLLTDTNSRESIMGYPEMKALLCSIAKARDISDSCPVTAPISRDRRSAEPRQLAVR